MLYWNAQVVVSSLFNARRLYFDPLALTYPSDTQPIQGNIKKCPIPIIVLNSLERTVEIKPYDRDSFDQAMKDYSRTEQEVVEGKKLEPVLVSAGPIAQLRKAYPNFFLDINEFVKSFRSLISSR
jgi:putative GTP pyrophosphokinase